MKISPPEYLSSGTLGEVEGLMTGELTETGEPDRSLSSRLGFLVNSVPDVVALTLGSAAPIADSIRGIYEAAGVDCPPLVGINSDGTSRWKHAHIATTRSEEVERLRTLTEGRNRAVIIDQFFIRGGSLYHAQELLEDAGVKSTALIKGRWFGAHAAQV